MLPSWFELGGVRWNWTEVRGVLLRGELPACLHSKLCGCLLLPLHVHKAWLMQCSSWLAFPMLVAPEWIARGSCRVMDTVQTIVLEPSPSTCVSILMQRWLCAAYVQRGLAPRIIRHLFQKCEEERAKGSRFRIICRWGQATAFTPPETC